MEVKGEQNDQSWQTLFRDWTCFSFSCRPRDPGRDCVRICQCVSVLYIVTQCLCFLKSFFFSVLTIPTAWRNMWISHLYKTGSVVSQLVHRNSENGFIKKKKYHNLSLCIVIFKAASFFFFSRKFMNKWLLFTIYRRMFCKMQTKGPMSIHTSVTKLNVFT